MKKIDNRLLLSIQGGGMASSFCAGVGIAGAGAALWNGAIAAGLITAGTIATGGSIALIVGGACAVYGVGNAFGWWS